MLDTNTVIYLINKRPLSVAARVSSLGPDDELCMSFVTLAELLRGAERSTRKAEVARGLDSLVRQVPVSYGTDWAMCEHYAQQSVMLKAAGTPIGGNDLWIACHALAEKATLVTNNIGEFQRVRGLVLENWV